MRRSVTIKKSADGGLVEVRAGDRVLGQVAGLASEAGGMMSGSFTHRPAFADFAPKFLELARAESAGRPEEVQGILADVAAGGVEVWHNSYDMRIDKPATLRIGEGRVRFVPNDAFLMMRTGGLG